LEKKLNKISEDLKEAETIVLKHIKIDAKKLMISSFGK